MKLLLIFILLFFSENIYAQANNTRTHTRNNSTNSRSSSNKSKNNKSSSKKTSITNSVNRTATALSYKTPELVLLESNYDLWTRYSVFQNVNNVPYGAVYYNPASHKYFFAKIYETNLSAFQIDPSKIDPVKSQEKTFDQEFKEYSLYYVGDVNDKTRVFLHTNRQNLFVKMLSPLQDDQFLDNDNTIKNNKLNVFPVLTTLYQVQYTNRESLIYNRLMQHNGVLRLLGTANPNSLQKIAMPKGSASPNSSSKKTPSKKNSKRTKK